MANNGRGCLGCLGAIALIGVAVVVLGSRNQSAAPASQANIGTPVQAPATMTPTPTPAPEKEYQAGIEAASAGQWLEAYQQFQKAVLLNPGYKDDLARFYEVNSRLRRPIHLVSDRKAWKATSATTDIADGWTLNPDYDDTSWSPPVLGQGDDSVPHLTDPDAEYIWAPNATGWDQEVSFRTVVVLDTDPYSAQVQMNVDHEYDFYVNGFDAGSDHASDGWSKIETYDVTRLLHAGKNVIAVHGKKEWGLESFVFSMDVQQMPPIDPRIASILSTYSTPTSTSTPTGTPTTTPTETPLPTDTPSPTSTPTLTLTPTSRPTPNVPGLSASLDTAWAKGDWPSAIEILQQLTRAVPTSKDYKSKLYVAHYNYGKALLAKGDKDGAIQQFEAAQQVDSTRGEAAAQLKALTPTPTPVLPTPTPTAGPWLSQPVETGGQAMIAGDLRFSMTVGYTRADPGKEIVLVYVAIKNVDVLGLRKTYNEFSDFRLRDGTGDIRGPVVVLGLDNQLGSGQLDADGTAQGWVPFEISKGDRNLTLLYHPCLLLCGEQQVLLSDN